MQQTSHQAVHRNTATHPWARCQCCIVGASLSEGIKHIECECRCAHNLLCVCWVYTHNRAAVFDVTGRKTTETPSVIFRFFHKTAWQESSNFYSDLRNTSSSELTKYYYVNCCCSAVTMPIRSSSYATSNTSELVVSVQLPLNSMFFCCVEVLSHVVLWHHSASMQLLYGIYPRVGWLYNPIGY